MLASLNAAGDYGPLLIIFKGKRLRAEWCFGAPNTLIRTSENGWINSELFLDWGKYFIAHLPKEDSRPHVLLLDGHSGHVFNIEFLTLMRDNNVHVMCFPPHTTHILQPADRAFFKSLKHHWNQEGQIYTRENGGRKLQRSLFLPLQSKSWKNAETPQNAKAGFRGSGIYPLDHPHRPSSVFS